MTNEANIKASIAKPTISMYFDTVALPLIFSKVPTTTSSIPSSKKVNSFFIFIYFSFTYSKISPG